MIDRLEARLSAALALGKAECGERKAESLAATMAESVESDAVSASRRSAEEPATTNDLRTDSGGRKPPPPESTEPPMPGEEAETAFLAEARERGEDVASVAAALAAAESAEEKGALPPLEELIQKLPAELRETLDDLFRAKFVRVMRVRKKDLPA